MSWLGIGVSALGKIGIEGWSLLAAGIVTLLLLTATISYNIGYADASEAAIEAALEDANKRVAAVAENIKQQQDGAVKDAEVRSEREAEKEVVVQTIIKEIPTYVSSDKICTVPAGAIRLLNNAGR